MSHHPPVPDQLSRLGFVLPGDDLRQRRLAGPILAHEAEDLATADINRDVVKSDDAGEAHAHVPGLEECGALEIGGRLSCIDAHRDLTLSSAEGAVKPEPASVAAEH